MLNIVYQSIGDRKKHLNFTGEACSIGYDKRNDFVVREKNVAKYHATINLDHTGQVILTDLSSKEGTWLNSQRLVAPQPIDERDEIVIGGTKIWVYNEAILNSATQNTVAPKVLPLIARDKSVLAEHSIDEELTRWTKLIHDKLLSQMDLRRKDIHKMADEELRAETNALIEVILEDLAGKLPKNLNINRLKENVLNEAVGLGPLELFLADDEVSEIMVNSHKEVFVERNGMLTASEFTFSSDQAVKLIIERIITPIGRRIDESSPMVDARLKDGSRINAVIPPLALKGPALTIRKFSKKRLIIDDLIGFGSLNREMAEFLRVAVENRRNVIVSGGTGTGKTTLLNVLSNFIPQGERIVTVEDSAELKLDHSNLVTLESKPGNTEGKGAISIRELVKNTLRMRPDRIVVGECRGGEALDMLQAMNTGHDGSLTTVHANSPRDLISRLEVMVLMSGMELPVQAIREQIASAVDIIVQQTRYPCGSRKISKITEVVGMESGVIQLQDVFSFKRNGYDEQSKVRGQFAAEGFIPSFYEELNEVGMDLDISIFRKHSEERTTW